MQPLLLATRRHFCPFLQARPSKVYIPLTCPVHEQHLTKQKFASAFLRRSYCSSVIPDAIAKWKDTAIHESTIEHDIITGSPINLLTNTLNDASLPYLHGNLPAPGDVVPLTYHHVFFPPRTLERELASDGYETNFVPPEPYVKRLWGGAEYVCNAENPLRVGDRATLTTTVDRIDYRNTGLRGDSVFVWLKKRIENEKGWSLEEKRCLCYVNANIPLGEPRAISMKKQPDFVTVSHPSPILLFRYSALTFNAHQIHYDYMYATGKENHSERLVHGPLSGTLLVSLLRSHLLRQGAMLDTSDIKLFQYKCLLPLYVNQPLTLCGKEISEGNDTKKCFDVWINNSEGHLAVKGRLDIGIAKD